MPRIRYHGSFDIPHYIHIPHSPHKASIYFLLSANQSHLQYPSLACKIFGAYIQASVLFLHDIHVYPPFFTPIFYQITNLRSVFSSFLFYHTSVLMSKKCNKCVTKNSLRFCDDIMNPAILFPCRFEISRRKKGSHHTYIMTTSLHLFFIHF